MTAPTTPDPLPALIDVATRARAELQAWMKLHGYDLDTADLIADIDSALRRARA